MSESVSNELLYETLKAIQGKLVEHDQHFTRLENELRAVKTHLEALVQTDLNRDGDLASPTVRIERIERRLEISG